MGEVESKQTPEEKRKEEVKWRPLKRKQIITYFVNGNSNKYYK